MRAGRGRVGWRAGRRLTAALLGCALAAGAARAQSENPAHQPSASDYGGVGLLQTRSARFLPDGTLDVSATFVDPYRRYAFTFQPLPWVEATFRYTDIRNRLYSTTFAFSGDQTFKDRGADLKFKLWPEGKYIPQVALGLQDGLGTGLFQSEYLVFSKRWYDFDFHAGVAWGLLGSRGTIKNPLTYLSDRFLSRNTDFGQGGTFNLGGYFSGPTVGLFGGVEWATPIDGLSLKLEYDGNNYQNDPLGNQFEVDLPINFGAVYRPLSFVELSGGFERGNTAMFRATLRANLKDSDFPKIDPAPVAVQIRPRGKPQDLPRGEPAPPPDGGSRETAALALLDPTLVDVPLAGAPLLDAPRRRPAAAEVPLTADARGDLVAALFDGLEAQGFEVDDIEVTRGHARVALHRRAGGDTPVPLQEAAAALAAAMPAAVEKVTLVEGGHAVSAGRAEIERAQIVDFLFDELAAQGYDLQALELSHDSVEVQVTPVAGATGQDATRAAGVLLRAMPVPVNQVRIVRLEAGVERARVVVGRAEAERAGRVDDLFDGLEAFGFEVELVDFARGQATVYVEASADTREADLERAARLVAARAPEPVDYVAVVGLNAGVEAMRVTWRRQPTDERPRAVAVAAGADRAPAAEVIPDLTREEKEQIATAIFADLGTQGYQGDAFHLTRFKATLFVTPTRYRQLGRNIGRASRIVANHVPPSVELIEIVTLSAGLETNRTTIVRRDLENAVAFKGSVEEVFAHAQVKGPAGTFGPLGGAFGGILGDTPEDLIENPDIYPAFSWTLRPAVRQYVGGPDSFFLYQVYLALSAKADIARGLSVSASVGKNLYNNFDSIDQLSDSQLPHVRSDIARYLQEGADGNIIKLQADYLFSPAPDWYARVSAGLFEEMYGGVGGEVLYHPYGSRLAVGIDVNRVRQRTFQQRLEFQDYEVTTGHLNVYYQIPYMDLLGEMHAGKFLAGDVGAQFALSRSFKSGVRIGVWATFTDVPFDTFGEGSFDKGFYVSVPFELFLPESTRSRGTFAFRPLTRDGGQMVGVGPRLYGISAGGNSDQVFDTWDRLLD